MKFFMLYAAVVAVASCSKRQSPPLLHKDSRGVESLSGKILLEDSSGGVSRTIVEEPAGLVLYLEPGCGRYTLELINTGISKGEGDYRVTSDGTTLLDGSLGNLRGKTLKVELDDKGKLRIGSD